MPSCTPAVEDLSHRRAKGGSRIAFDLAAAPRDETVGPDEQATAIRYLADAGPAGATGRPERGCSPSLQPPNQLKALQNRVMHAGSIPCASTTTSRF